MAATPSSGRENEDLFEITNGNVGNAVRDKYGAGMKKSPIRDFVFSVLVSVSACLLMFLLIEVVLRLAGYAPYYLNAQAFEPSRIPDMVYELRPSFKGLYAGLPITVNSDGFRGREISPDAARAAVRIVVVGDSVAFGQGVPDDQTLADDLASRLKARLHQTVLAANLGVPGYDTCQESAMFRERAIRLKPQTAVLIYVDNDTDPPSIQVRNGAMITSDVRIGVFGDFMAWLRKASRAYNFAWAHWQVIKSHHVTIEQYREMLERKFSDANPGWIRSKACLNDFAQLARAQSVRPVVVPFPELAGSKVQPYPFGHYIQTVCREAAKDGAECADVVPDLQNADIPLRVSSIESHPSAAVYDRIARRLDAMLP